MDQPFLLHQYFDDFDDFCVNARNWDLEYRQIEPGPFSGELLIGFALNWWTSRIGAWTYPVPVDTHPIDAWTISYFKVPMMGAQVI